MILELPDTTTAKVAKELVNLREEGGAVALGRVLTLLISTTLGEEEVAIAAANEASREHPMRVIVLSVIEPEHSISNRLDAEVRVGGDAGASEVIVLRAYGKVGSDQQGLVTGLLLPDTPVVAWWPGTAPEKVSESALGKIAQCRITDSAAQSEPLQALNDLSRTYSPGDADFAWTRLTLWRTQLAAVLDQPPYEPIIEAHVTSTPDFPAAKMLAAWLQLQLQVPVTCDLTHTGLNWRGVHGVRLVRKSGDIELTRVEPTTARLKQPDQPNHDISMPLRSLRDCLAEELRRLDPDEVYGRVVTEGLPQIKMVTT
ncbi:glucose-6-phosphate dehydrogenase assembly protein OpcA [Aurantimicrobium minutum]|uniref:glucose-6-phosphate dehydrogenase assembly protein OpcA n=1 Tax=Aurantimicrobium minutum TaxID=708131 RepID=UPI0024736E6C|nr:glucose-6-phosphate dehydrogenase assembly protein OpcA [Aurantimicrobium minutum]MDH6239254.1 glucose-6-phosphate dehydrogenase assembly protein OpcA [Aurantimicrobium minutum]